MTVRQRKSAAAFSIAEVMVAATMLVITATGASSYQYHAAREAQIARAHIAATRTAQLLLEDWTSTGGSSEYDPSTLGLGFSSAKSIPSHFSQGQGGGLGDPLNDAVHSIAVDDIPMLVMLTSRDIAQDTQAQVILRQLGVIVEFSEETQITERLENIESVTLTTYVRVGASSG